MLGFLTIVFIALVIFARKWEPFQFWYFDKFGKRFRDREEREEVPDLEMIDYDAFINYQ